MAVRSGPGIGYVRPDEFLDHLTVIINAQQALFTIDINGQMDEQVTKYLFGTLHKIIFVLISADYGLGAHINENEVVTIGR